jgi:hypothetical protein
METLRSPLNRPHYGELPSPMGDNWDIFPPDEFIASIPDVTLLGKDSFRPAGQAFRPYERDLSIQSSKVDDARELDAKEPDTLSREGYPMSPRIAPTWAVDENGKRYVKNSRVGTSYEPTRRERLGRAAVEHIPGIHHLRRLGGGHGHHHHQLTAEEAEARERMILERLPQNRQEYPKLFNIDNIRRVRAYRWEIANAAAAEWRAANDTDVLPLEVKAAIRDDAHEQALTKYITELAGTDTPAKLRLEVGKSAILREEHDRAKEYQAVLVARAATRASGPGRRMEFRPPDIDAADDDLEDEETNGTTRANSRQRSRPAHGGRQARARRPRNQT